MKLKALIATILVFMLLSCEHQQPLCFDHDASRRQPLEVVFDWTDCPDAAPATMSLYLFPADGSHFTRHEFIGRDGGMILISPGHYSAVALNSDNDLIRVVNKAGTYRDFSVTLRDAYESQAMSAGRNGAGVCQAPDALWMAWLDDVEVAGSCLEIDMHELLCHYSLEVRHLGDGNLVRSIDATLSDMNVSLVPQGRSAGGDGIKLLFPVNHVDSCSARGDFFTLGHCGLGKTRGDSTVHCLDFYFTVGDGSVRHHSFDVTDQVHSQPVERCHIVIDSVEVLKSSSHGVNIAVDEWNTIEIPISTN